LRQTAGGADREIRAIALADGRHIPVPGTCNLRDVGGYPTLAGGSLHWRALFRSDGLHRLDADGVAGLAVLGLHTIVDLRADIELEQSPSATAGLPAQMKHIPIVRDPTLLPAGLDRLDDEYQYMVDECGDAFGAVVRELCRPRALPALVHCAGGRDRTGIVVALVLAVLGVADELIGVDYSLSDAYLDPDMAAAIGRFQATGLADKVTSELLTSQSGLILRALFRARSLGGGAVDGYLAAHGVSPDELRVLRSVLAG
jgi:protein-tyrosine phosphatase